MKSFPVATKCSLYLVEGKIGVYTRMKYSEARLDPFSVRAMIGNKVCWFKQFEEVLEPGIMSLQPEDGSGYHEDDPVNEN